MGTWKTWLLTAAVGFMIGCSGSTSSGGSKDDESSSGGNTSSDGGTSSSSSVTIPDGARAATLDDIPRVVQFPDYEKYEVLYVIGESGVFSKLYIDSTGTTKLQILGSYKLSSNGEMSFTRLNCIIMATNLTSVCEDADALASQIFVVEEEELKAGHTEAELAVVEAGSLVEKMVVLNKASDAVGEWSIIKGDSTFTLQLYSDLRFVMKTLNSSDEEVIAAGNFDIQDGILLGAVEYWNGSVPAAIMYKAVKKNGQLSLINPVTNKADTLSAGTLPTTLSTTALQTTWTSEKVNSSGDATHLFEMEFTASSVVHIRAADASNGDNAYTDEGEYVSFGDLLILDMNKGARCTGNRTIGIINGATFNCFSQIMGAAEIEAGALTFDNEFIPTEWEKK